MIVLSMMTGSFWITASPVTLRIPVKSQLLMVQIGSPRREQEFKRAKDEKALAQFTPRLSLCNSILLELVYGQEPPLIEMVSTFHPGATTASSVPIRKRSVMVCPFTLGPRSTTVLM